MPKAPAPDPDLGPLYVPNRRQLRSGGRGGSANSQGTSGSRPQTFTLASNASASATSKTKKNLNDEHLGQPAAKIPKKSIRQQMEELEVSGRKVLAEVTHQPAPNSPFFCLATLGTLRPDVPTGFKVTAETKVVDDEKTFEQLLATLVPGSIYEILNWQPPPRPPMQVITKWPNHDMAIASEIKLQIEPQIVNRLSMVISTKDRKFIDPIQKVEKFMGPSFMQHLRKVHDGQVIQLSIVKYPAATRYLDANQGFFSPMVQTPIDCKINTATRHEVCSIIKASPNAPQFKELKLDRRSPNGQKNFRDVGRAIWLALTVIESRITQDRKSCTFTTDNAKWELDDETYKLMIEVTEADKVNLKNFAQAFTKGALACIRDGETLASPENRPLTMLVDKAEFNESFKQIMVKMMTPVTLVNEVFELKENVLPPKKLQLAPSADPIHGKELALKLMKNDLPMMEKGKPPLPQKIFKAALKVPITEEGITVITKAYEIPKRLTEDQKKVIIEMILKNKPVILCQAVAGSGKTTVIVEAIKLLKKLYPGKTPVVISVGNEPVMHVVEEFTEEEIPPLLISSMIAIKKLSPERAAKLARMMFLQHIIETLKLPDLTSAQQQKLNKALKVEATLQKELLDTMEDGELKDAIREATYVYDDLLGAYQSQIFDYDYDEEDENETTKPPTAKTSEEIQETRAKILKDAIVIILQKRPPPVIAGTAAMVTRLGPALGEFVDTLIIDEAATLSQIMLLSVLAEVGTITSLVMVGDKHQLQVYAKNIHETVMDLGFRSSLEVMSENTGNGVAQLTLSTTFRFHPLLLKLINALCYPGLELTTPITADQRAGFAECFKLLGETPAMLLHCDGPESDYFPLSSKNDSQTKMAMAVLNRLEECGKAASVISLYNGQKMAMKRAMGDTDHTCASVDAFQGHEDDYIIVITTKTSNLNNNKFFNNLERKTVSLSRARCGLIVLGDVNELRTSPAWRPFVQYCEENKCYYTRLPDKP